METSHRVTGDCEAAAPTAHRTEGEPHGGPLLRRGPIRRGLNHRRSPETLAAVAGLRRFSRRLVGFSAGNLAHSDFGRLGRFCPLRRASRSADAFDCMAHPGG